MNAALHTRAVALLATLTLTALTSCGSDGDTEPWELEFLEPGALTGAPSEIWFAHHAEALGEDVVDVYINGERVVDDLVIHHASATVPAPVGAFEVELRDASGEERLGSWTITPTGSLIVFAGSSGITVADVDLEAGAPADSIKLTVVHAAQGADPFDMRVDDSIWELVFDSGGYLDVSAPFTRPLKQSEITGLDLFTIALAITNAGSLDADEDPGLGRYYSLFIDSTRLGGLAGAIVYTNSGRGEAWFMHTGEGRGQQLEEGL